MTVLAFVAMLQTQPLTRSEFVQRYFALAPGASKDEIRRQLGPPDEILTESDPLIADSFVRERWDYGVKRHGDFPTLGAIWIDSGGKREIPTSPDENFANWRRPEASEETLQKGIRALSEYCTSFGEGMSPDFNLDPLACIRAAITLQALGKDAALDCIREFVRVSHGINFYWSGDSTLAVLKLLFHVPDEYNRLPSLMKFDVAGDIPLHPQRGQQTFTGSLDVIVSRYIEDCDVHGVWRTSPIQPTISADMMEAWKEAARNLPEVHLLLRNCYPTPLDSDLTLADRGFDFHDKPTWDPHARAFHIPGAPVYPDPIRRTPRLAVWTPKSLRKDKVRIILGRNAVGQLIACIKCGGKRMGDSVEVVTVGPHPKVIVSSTLPSTGWGPPGPGDLTETRYQGGTAQTEEQSIFWFVSYGKHPEPFRAVLNQNNRRTLGPLIK